MSACAVERTREQSGHAGRVLQFPRAWVEYPDGQELLQLLRDSPLVPVGDVVLNFNDDFWDCSTDNLPPDQGKYMRYTFENSPDKDIWKLFLLYNITWSGHKTVTVIMRLRTSLRMMRRCGVSDAMIGAVMPNAYHSYRAKSYGKLAKTVCDEARALRDFLEFRRLFFNIPIDEELEQRIQHDIESYKQHTYDTAIPVIPDSYLEPLVQACLDVLADENAKQRPKIYASAILIASQTGVRISEILGMEPGKVQVSHFPGKEDIAYLEYRVFKGVPGDTGYKTHVTVMNELALKGYRWLEEHCKDKRETLGTTSLIVMPLQRNKHITTASFRWGLNRFILSQHEVVPCVNTQAIYPELQHVPTSTFLGREKGSIAFGLTGKETFVYPKFHSFRATVATKHYERGDDMHYISKRMGHLSEAVTAGYIKSDREIEQANNDIVYRSVLEDDAEFIGPHGSEFKQLVDRYVETLPDQVKADLDAVVEAAGEKFPLRRKVGGVCIRCARIVPCKRNDETDQIYCAFGVCPNQCVLYFMADQCLDAIRGHIAIVKRNRERGHEKAARNELRKAQNVIKSSLVPELDSLEQQVEAHGRDHVLVRFPELEQIVDTLPEIREEIEQWLAMSI